MTARDNLLGVELGRRLRLRVAGLIVIAVGAGEPLPGLAKELTPPLARAQRLRQLIATRVAVELILGLINRLGLGEDLARDLPKVAIRTAAGVRRQPRPVDRDDPRPDQPGLIAEREHLREQRGQRRLVTLDEPRDRRVIRHLEASRSTDTPHPRGTRARSPAPTAPHAHSEDGSKAATIAGS